MFIFKDSSRLQNSPSKCEAGMGMSCGQQAGEMVPGAKALLLTLPWQTCQLHRCCSPHQDVHSREQSPKRRYIYIYICRVQRKPVGYLLLEVVHSQTKEQSFEEKFCLLKDIS